MTITPLQHLKRFTALLLFAALPATADAALRVFACEPEWAALATEIGGDRVQVYTATTAFQDPHHVDAKPSLIAQVRKADIVVCTGAGLELGWLPLLLTRSANPALKDDRLFFAAAKVQRLNVPSGPVDRSKGDIHAEGNPHVHLDPRRMLAIGDALAGNLGRLDAGNAAYYAQRAADLRKRLEAKLAQFNTAALKSRRYFVYHDAWPYLMDWLSTVQAGTVEPLPGVPPSSQHLARLAGLAKSQPVAATLHAGYDDRQAVQWLARNAGVCGIELPYTVGGAPGTADLVSFYTEVVVRLNKGC